jgi:hypothetical protein
VVATDPRAPMNQMPARTLSPSITSSITSTVDLVVCPSRAGPDL